MLNYRLIPLTQGKHAIVDEDDYSLLNQRKWHAITTDNGGSFYAVGWHEGRKIRMHRFLLGAKPSEIVDHVNGNGLDNRRANIRITDNYGNTRNRRQRSVMASKYKGVCRRPRGRWAATIRIDGKQRSIGEYASELEAALAYDAAALHYYGEYACPNLPGIAEPATREELLRRNYHREGRLRGAFPRPNGKWASSIHVSGANQYLGTFDTELAAALAYDEAARPLGRITNF